MFEKWICVCGSLVVGEIHAKYCRSTIGSLNVWDVLSKAQIVRHSFQNMLTLFGLNAKLWDHKWGLTIMGLESV